MDNLSQTPSHKWQAISGVLFLLLMLVSAYTLLLKNSKVVENIKTDNKTADEIVTPQFKYGSTGKLHQEFTKYIGASYRYPDWPFPSYVENTNDGSPIYGVTSGPLPKIYHWTRVINVKNEEYDRQILLLQLVNYEGVERGQPMSTLLDIMVLPEKRSDTFFQSNACGPAYRLPTENEVKQANFKAFDVDPEIVAIVRAGNPELYNNSYIADYAWRANTSIGKFEALKTYPISIWCAHQGAEEGYSG